MSEIHDKFCYNQHYSKRECNCSLIERVREDIASKIIKYGQDTHFPHDPRIACQRCDIVAAYNYAAEIARGK